MNDDTLSTLAGLGMAAARQRESMPDVQPPRAEPPQVLAVAEIEVYDGASVWDATAAETVDTPAGPATRVLHKHVIDAFDPHEYDPVQPAEIRVRHRHDRAHTVGRVVHLEWGKGEPARILAVFAVDQAEVEFWAGQDVYVSPGTKRNDRGQLVLDHIGLTSSTARIAAAPVKWAGTTFEQRSRWTRQTVPGYELLMRAADAHRKRAKGAGIEIVGHPGFDEQQDEQAARSRVPGPLMPEYMRNNGEGGLFYSGGGGRILRIE